jgi:hypothetical protein
MVAEDPIDAACLPGNARPERSEPRRADEDQSARIHERIDPIAATEEVRRTPAQTVLPAGSSQRHSDPS